jgi:magnesium transporter
VPLRQEVFFGFPVYASGAVSDRVFLSFLCLKNLCITLHRTPIESLSKVARASSGGLGLPEATTSTLVSVLLVGLGAPIVDGTEAARTAVLALEERMDHDPDAVEIGQILDQSDVIRGLDSIVSEHVFCLSMLGLVDSPALSLAANGYFHTVTSTAQHLDRTVDRLEIRAADLRQRYGMNQQDRTNRHLAVLTVVAAIFLPLTLFTGIYGMNFDVMPELHYKYGYPVALGFMAILAGWLVWYFHYRGWFK